MAFQEQFPKVSVNTHSVDKVTRMYIHFLYTNAVYLYFLFQQRQHLHAHLQAFQTKQGISFLRIDSLYVFYHQIKRKRKGDSPHRNVQACGF